MQNKPPISEQTLNGFRHFLSEKFGLSFPKEKHNDLERGIYDIMPLLHEEDPTACLIHLKEAPLTNEQIEILTAHFTIGETYFFREPDYFKTLQQRILPKLIAERRSTEKRLRIWSAGCSTGEEAYSIAIMVSQLIEDLQDWNITILATDINITSLKKLKEGIYGEWSFRGVPQEIKKEYFNKVSNHRYQILPSIKKMVTPGYLNLAQDAYPSLINNTTAMDLIFCRNLLMYFVPSLISKVVKNLENSLIEEGMLVVGASDNALVPHHLFKEYRVLDTIFYVKKHSEAKLSLEQENIDNALALDLTASLDEAEDETEISEESVLWREQLEIELLNLENTMDLDESETLPWIDKNDLETTESTVVSESRKPEPPSTHKKNTATLDSIEKQSRLLANQGKLDEALQLINQGLTMDKCHSRLHYLKALVLQELGIIDETVAELKKTIYLDANFILAYFTLGNIAANQQHWKNAKKYYSIVLTLSEQYDAEDMPPGSEGAINIKRMREIIHSNKNIF